MNYTLKSEQMTFTVSTRGAELISAKDNFGREYIWCADEKYWNEHAPLLFPICGRLKDAQYTYKGKTYDMGIHGFLRFCDFTVLEADCAHIKLELQANEQTLAQYPFAFTVIAEYKAEKCKLICSYFIKNNSGEGMPFAFGLHPGFNLFTDGGADIDDYEILFDRCDIAKHPLQHDVFVSPYSKDIRLDYGIYPIRESSLYEDKTVILTGSGNRAVLRNRVNAHKIEMTYSENLPYFCLWKAEDNAAKYLCLEPWSGTPSDGESAENFETRQRMLHLAPEGVEKFTCNIDFSFNL